MLFTCAKQHAKVNSMVNSINKTKKRILQSSCSHGNIDSNNYSHIKQPSQELSQKNQEILPPEYSTEIRKDSSQANSKGY